MRGRPLSRDVAGLEERYVIHEVKKGGANSELLIQQVYGDAGEYCVISLETETTYFKARRIYKVSAEERDCTVFRVGGTSRGSDIWVRRCVSNMPVFVVSERLTLGNGP